MSRVFVFRGHWWWRLRRGPLEIMASRYERRVMG